MNLASTKLAARYAMEAYQAERPADGERQIAVLKQALNAQKNQGEELLRLIDGKGKIIDIRA